MKKVILTAVVVGLLLTVLPAATASAAPPSTSRYPASPGVVEYLAPPAQGSLFAKVAGLWIQLYEDSQLQTLGARVWQSTFLEVGESSGNARYVQAFTFRPQVIQGELVTTRIDVARGWVNTHLFMTGQVVFLSGAFLPPWVVERGAQYVLPISHCQKWLECNGERRLPGVWGWIDQKGIITTHPEDCKPFWGKPRPRGCYP